MSKFSEQMRPFRAADLRGLRGLLRLTQSDVADILGMGANGERTIRRIEREEIDPRTRRPHQMTGPMQVALGYLQQGALNEVMRQVIPEFIIGDDMSLMLDMDYVIRLWYPRFVGVLMESLGEAEGIDHIAVGPMWLVIPIWIDPPGDLTHDILRRAATSIVNYTAHLDTE